MRKNIVGIRNIFLNRVVKNASWIIGGKIVYMAFAFVVGLLTARYLGASNFGTINYATAYTTFFASLCTLGINSVIVKELVDNPKEEGCVIGTALVLRGISSVLSSLMIIGIVSIVDAGEKITIIVVALSSIGLFFQIFDTFNYWFQAHLQSKYSAIASTVAYIVMSVYKVLLLATGQSVELFALATSVEYIAVAIILFVAYKKQNGPKLSISMAKAKSLLTASCHFIIAGLMVSIYESTDRLMLKQMINETAVGYYSTAVSICNVWAFVLSAVIDSVYPVIMKNFKEDIKKFNAINRLLYAIIFYIATFVSVLFLFWGKFAVNLLYGKEYLPAVAPLNIITWYVAFSYLGVARNAWVVSYHKQKYLVYLYVGAALTNVVLNYFWIPILGTVGAALASLITQASTILVFPLFIKDLRSNVKLIIDGILLRGIR